MTIHYNVTDSRWVCYHENNQKTIYPICTLCHLRLAFIPRLDSPIKNLVNDTHIQRLLRTHEVIPLHKLLDFIERHLLLPGQVSLIDLVELMANAQDFLGMDGNIGRLSEVAAGWLVDHDRRVRETVSLAWVATAEKQGSHGCSLADANSANRGCDVGHCIVDCETCY